MRFLNKYFYIFLCLSFQLEWNYRNYNSIGYVCQSLFYWFHIFQLRCLIGCMYVSYSSIGLMYVSPQRLSVHSCAPTRVILRALIFSITGVGQTLYSHKNSQHYYFVYWSLWGYSKRSLWNVWQKCTLLKWRASIFSLLVKARDPRTLTWNTFVAFIDFYVLKN